MRSILKNFFLASLLAILLSACAPTLSSTAIPPVQPPVQIVNPYPPQSIDGTLVRGTVEIVKTELLSTAMMPPQLTLAISFFVPTPCDQYRITIDQPAGEKRINIEVYSLMVKDKPCTLMRLSTPTVANLDLGNLSPGHYAVWVNGAKALEFDR